MCFSASLRGRTRLPARSPHRKDSYEGLALRLFNEPSHLTSPSNPPLSPDTHTKHALSRRQHTVSSLLAGISHRL